MYEGPDWILDIDILRNIPRVHLHEKGITRFGGMELRSKLLLKEVAKLDKLPCVCAKSPTDDILIRQDIALHANNGCYNSLCRVSF
ncbi:hypothetical protein ACFX15_005387 [Malus domestica]